MPTLPQQLRATGTGLFLGVFLLTGACAGEGPADTDAPQSEVADPARAAQSGAGDEADVRNYRLTMDRVDKWYAAQRNLQALEGGAADEIEAIEDENADENASIDEMARKLESDPRLAAAVRSAGLTTREYVVASFALFQAGMAVAILDMQPEANQDSLMRSMKVSPENVRFVRENKAELQRRQAATAER